MSDLANLGFRGSTYLFGDHATAIIGFNRLRASHGDLALLVGPQLVELASGVSETSGFGDACGEQRLVAALIVADQRAAPMVEEGSGMTFGPTLGEVEHHRRH